MKKTLLLHCVGLLLCSMAFSRSVTGALVDLGNGTILDADRGLMWLRDANYSFTSGYDGDGQMTWQQAHTWVDQLTFAGYDDWRLPSALEPNGTGPFDGHQFENPENPFFTDSELGHLYYTEGINSLEHGPFINLQLTGPGSYWFAEESDALSAWDFAFGQTGMQDTRFKHAQTYSWAVRSLEDPQEAVPESSTWATFLGIAFFATVAGRRHSNARAVRLD